jgi:adhesin transport system membrane fusion protein
MSARNEFDFANDARAAVLERTPWAAWVQTIAIGLLVASAIGWAYFARLDVVTHAVGRVVPSSQLQVVQTLEPGIVSEISVREGDIVEKDQVLMQINDASQASRAGEIKQKRYALLATIARLEAAERQQPTLTAPANADADLLRSFASEQATLDSDLQKFKSERVILGQQTEQRRQELKELEATRQKLKSTLVPLTRELKLTRSLSKRGFVPEIEVLRLVRQQQDFKGQIEIVDSSLPRAQSAISEAEERLAVSLSVFRSEILRKLTQARNELAILSESERASDDQVARTSLRAPVRGVVNKITVSSIGAVVQPGQDIISIVPIEDNLQIEAQVRPKDVAFIRPGHKASIKLTAYDYTIYGALEGEIKRISADTIQDANGEAFYRVMVSTPETHIIHDGKKLPVIPGMQASVDILTGDKTVLDYLLKPVSKIRNEALREN